MIEVTDPDILNRLDSAPSLQEVTDPYLIEKLESSPLKKAGKFVSEYYGYLHQPTEPPKDTRDFLTRVAPESISKTAVGLAEFPYIVGKGIGDVIQKRAIEGQPAINPDTGKASKGGRVIDTVTGIGEEISKNVVGMARFVGEPIGAFGLEKAKERWSTDPAGSLLGVAPILHAGIRTAARLKPKPAADTVNPPIKKMMRPVEDPAILEQLEEPVATTLPVAPEAPPVTISPKVEAQHPPDTPVTEATAVPKAGELFPGQKKEFRLSSSEAPEAAKPFAPAPAEQPLLTGTEKAYKDVGMRERIADPVTEQVDSLRSILPDFELGKKIWSQDKIKPEVIGNTPNMYPPWFKEVFRNDSAREVMSVIDKWKEGGDSALGKKESRIMASVRDLAQDAATRGEDIGESHWRYLLNESGSLDVSALRPIAETGRELADAYKRPPEITESKKIIGRYTGALQVIDHELTKVAKDINKKLPKDKQKAITNYMQAGGDEAILKDRATTGNVKYRKGYQDALALTPEEKTIAESFRKRQNDIWQLANDAGVLESYVENYVRGEWERPNKAGRKLLAQVSSGQFRTKPREALKKVFQDYYEGEQAGFVPKDKRIGYQLISAERSLKYAIEAKKALKDLMGSKEKDGRPTVAVGGGGSYMGEAAGAELPAYYVKPNILPKDVGDYKYLAHPSLRGWKWVGSDAAGKPILLEGNMWIHPEAYGKVNALLGRSKIREFTVPERVPVIGGTQPGRAALNMGAFIKGTILLGPFHQVHVGIHAVFHKVRPFNLPEIDFNKRPVLREGVDHGLMLSNHNAITEFGEGLTTGGLFHRIPGVGNQLIRYQEWLFQNYIPKLKAAMYEHAVERAEGYYKKELTSGKFTRDQLLENAAKQANSAFGEQNYKYIGRNPTLQDALRIALLAPDFLEARLKFAGQALRPYGKEQSMALIRGALMMGVTAQTINMMIGDEKKPHWDRPFSIIIGGREYAPRSVVADMMHLISDPRSFAYFRLNPLWGRPLVEMASGRDANGRKVGIEDAARDVLKSLIPIPGQGIVKKNQGDTILGATVNALLQSTGVSNYQFRSDAERKMMELMPRIDKVRTPEQKKISELRRQVLPMLRKGKTLSELPEGLKNKLLGLTDKQLKRIQSEGEMTAIQSGFKHLSAEDAIEVWKVMTPQEKELMEEEYSAKLSRKSKDMSDEDYESFKELIRQAE